MRALEYYSGILFLTTNRVGSIDEALRSRIHMSVLSSLKRSTDGEDMGRATRPGSHTRPEPLDGQGCHHRLGETTLPHPDGEPKGRLEWQSDPERH